jgi:hypothetical protein
MKFINKQFTETKLTSEYYLLNMLEFQKLNFERTFKNNKSELLYSIIDSSSVYLLVYFLFNSVHDYNSLKTRKISYHKSNELSTIELFINNFDFKNFIDSLNVIGSLQERERNLIELIYCDYELSKRSGGSENYYKLKSKISVCEKYLDRDLMFLYLQKLNIYCILEISDGKKELEKELFENLKLMLEKNLYSIKNQSNFSILDFRLILFSAIRVKEYEWAEYFINEYYDHLVEDSRQKMLNFGYAFLFFERKEFLNSLSITNKLKFDSFVLYLDVNILRLQIFYELNYHSNAISLIDTFKHFLRNNKYVSEYVKTRHRNFLKLYSKLFKFNRNPVYHEMKILREMIKDEKFLIKKNWLLDKINELITKQ